MTDERRGRPPIRPPPPSDDDEVYVPPAPAPKLPREPFMDLVAGRRRDAVTLEQLGNKIEDILAVQRKTALMVDGQTSAFNARFDLFHEELALVRHDMGELAREVQGDHAPRLERVERTLGQKAKEVVSTGGKAGLLMFAGSVLVQALPQYRGLIEALLQALHQ